nr:nucleotide-binding alpha-beta plait domain-containing protein [Tanacetum cinerariifolium]
MGNDDWQAVSRRKYIYSTKEDDVAKISTSIFVTNFPDSISAKDLFNSCKTYGHVVDSFIPTKRNKNGKRFGFVRFINVFNIDRLVGNLCTVWIDRHKLVNTYGGPKVHFNNPPNHSSKPGTTTSSFVLAVKGGMPHSSFISPALVLDDSCVVKRELGNFVMGEVKNFSSINNMHIVLANEGFPNAKVVYLGGMWVKLELPSLSSKDNFMKHVEGEKQTELGQKMNSEEEESDIEAVSDTYFGENIDKDGGNNVDSVIQPVDKETSHDPFNIYDILNKQKKDAKVNGSDSNIPFPLGFTPIQSNLKAAEQVKNSVLNQSPHNYSGCSSRILENSHKVDDHLITVNHGKCLSQKEGGSILKVLEEVIKVGQTMGFSMEGVHKDMEKIIAIFLDKHLSDHRPILLREILKKEIRVFVVNQRKNKEAAKTHDFMQKAKIKWAVEEGENFKFFHGMVNRKRANLAVKGIMIDGAWVDDPREVKNEAAELKVHITRDEIQNAVWCCGENKSPGPDGFSFDFFRKFWQVVGPD